MLCNFIYQIKKVLTFWVEKKISHLCKISQIWVVAVVLYPSNLSLNFSVLLQEEKIHPQNLIKVLLPTLILGIHQALARDTYRTSIIHKIITMDAISWRLYNKAQCSTKTCLMIGNTAHILHLRNLEVTSLWWTITASKLRSTYHHPFLTSSILIKVCYPLHLTVTGWIRLIFTDKHRSRIKN